MKKLLSLLFVTSSVFSMQLDLVKYDKKINNFKEKLAKVSNFNESQKILIKPSSVFIPNKIGSADLYHGKKGFSVYQDGKKHQIKKYFTDPMIRNISQKQLKGFLKGGYLSLNQMDDGEFSLKAKGRINGGGPLLGTAMYWVTKSLCYGTAVAAVGTVTIATGGAVGGVIGGAVAGGTVVGVGTAATTTAIATTAGVVTGSAATTGAVVSGGATVIAGAITGAGLAGEAAIVTGAAVTSAGSIGATIVAVESLSVAVGSFFGMLPTP